MAYPYFNPKGSVEHSTRLRQERERELVLDPELLSDLGLSVTTHAAHATWRAIENAYKNAPPQNSAEYDALKIVLDQAAVTAMEQALHAQKLFKIRSVGSEGAKEVQYIGQAAPNVQGTFGPKLAVRRDIVTDAVEGTTAASKNSPGAISIMALSEFDGILPSQDGQFYMDKLFAPAELLGRVSLDQSAYENIQTALEVLRINPPELTVVVLNRSRNKEVIEAAQKLGVDLQLIEAGDLMPSILAASGRKSQSGNHVMVMGIGGYEEGVISAAAAKALGGVSEGRLWSGSVQLDAPVLRQDDLVSGSAHSLLVSATAITADRWFGLCGAAQLEGQYPQKGVTDSIVVTASGLQIYRQPKLQLR